MSHIGRLVKHHRKRAGITQLELADIVGIGKTAVVDIEHAKSTVQVNSLLSVLNDPITPSSFFAENQYDSTVSYRGSR